jgi:hypothetical protein
VREGSGGGSNRLLHFGSLQPGGSSPSGEER